MINKVKKFLKEIKDYLKNCSDEFEKSDKY